MNVYNFLLLAQDAGRFERAQRMFYISLGGAVLGIVVLAIALLSAISKKKK